MRINLEPLDDGLVPDEVQPDTDEILRAGDHGRGQGCGPRGGLHPLDEDGPLSFLGLRQGGFEVLNPGDRTAL